jgi:NAD(P)-dependent dehydrogenase (short-subunit alcohol dehydrogenase family)
VLRGKVALITGATRGIGLAVAQALAEQGCQLVLTARDKRNLDKVKRELAHRKLEPLIQPCDVRDPAAVDKLMSAVRKRFGRLGILINNAGIAHSQADVDKFPIQVWQEVIDTNLTGMFLVTRAALSLMKHGGAIVNNLSISARRVFPGSSAYNASKHGGLGLTNTLREELRPRGIRVIALLPGATNTEIWNDFWPDAPREKMIDPETVALAVVNALCVPADATVEELVVLPPSGTL